MSVPEAAMYEDDASPTRKNDVGAPNEQTSFQAKAESMPVQERTNLNLRLCIPPSDPGHHATACLAVNDVRHQFRRRLLFGSR